MQDHPYYEVHGKDGPLLLLIHGMLSGRAQWLLNVPDLARTCRPVVMELWGHGRSPAPEDPACYSYPHYLAQLEWLRGELGAERWFVCGQSFGATVTIRYAIEHSDRVLGQVFTNSASALVGVGQRSDGSRRGGASEAEAEQRMQAIIAGGRKFIEEMRIHPRHARNLPEEAKQALLEDAALVDPRGMAMMFRYLGDSSVVGMLERNQVPSLLVCGGRETSFAPGREVAERNMPHLEVVVAEAGHAVNIQQAALFNEVVGDFVRRHTPR